MARYIDADALIDEIKSNINTYWNEGAGGYYLAEDALEYSVKTAPTADVVPKSEVVCSLDKLTKVLQKRQKYCDKEAEKCGYYLERRGEFDGESAGLDYCLEKIAELKKKYTEEKE